MPGRGVESHFRVVPFTPPVGLDGSAFGQEGGAGQRVPLGDGRRGIRRRRCALTSRPDRPGPPSARSQALDKVACLVIIGRGVDPAVPEQDS